MADYIGMARSNYFRVKDPQAFKALCERFNLELITQQDQQHGLLHGWLNENGGIPDFEPDADGGDGEEVDFMGELAEQLEPGWVAVAQEIGYEKMCYLNGYAVAVNSEGKQVEVAIQDVFQAARKAGLGELMTGAEY